jgi:hypothetical protein
MSGLMQPGPTLYEAEQQRKKKGSRGLLGEVGEPLSYAPGPVGLLGNALLGAQYMTGEKPMDEGLSALAMLTAMLQGTKVAPIVRNAIKVYHGSPHKFDKASSEHIGKGEGAQAYGHGLYWAEDKGVAESYRNAMNDWYPNAAKTKPGTVEDAAAAHVASAIDGQYQNPYAQAKEWIRRQGGPLADQKIAAIEKWQREGVEFKRGGSVYEASLRWPDAAREAADPLSAKHFLDWDKPLSEQGETGKALMRVLRQRQESGKWGNLPSSNQYDDYGETFADVTGKDVYSNLLVRLSNREKWRSPEYFGTSIMQQAKGDQNAARYLRKLGIPGITYLDAGSRAAGTGTRNYVTFDDELVELLKRNGLPISGLLGP